MNKLFHTLVLLTFFIMTLPAQLLLDVEGNAKIVGQLDLSFSDGSSIFIGSNAGGNVDGSSSNNTFIGIQAGRDNTSGSSNTFLGHQAGLQNIVGTNNTFLGKNAGQANKTGGSNTFVGRSAGETNSTGSSNTFVGEDAGKQNIAGSLNTFVGENAGLANVGGGSNTFVGADAGTANTGGDNNAFFGEDAGQMNTTGNNNTFVGENSGRSNGAGSSNTFVGQGAGDMIFTGNNNMAIGASANINNGLSNAIAVGQAAISDASNKVVIGNMAATPIGGWDAWTDYGVGGPGLRAKNKSNNKVKGLDFILKLNPVTYHVDYLQHAEKLYGAGADTIVVGDYRQALIEKSNIRKTAFIGEEVAEAAKAANYDFNGVVEPNTKSGTYGLKYGLFTVPLVQSVQELHEQDQDLEEKYQTLKEENETLRAEVEALKTMVQSLVANRSTEHPATLSISHQKTSLSNNQPNPFSKHTQISYTVPVTAQQAYLQISNLQGQVVQQINLAKGQHQLELNGQGLEKGTFFYSLVVDGQVVASQQMVVQ